MPSHRLNQMHTKWKNILAGYEEKGLDNIDLMRRSFVMDLLADLEGLGIEYTEVRMGV